MGKHNNSHTRGVYTSVVYPCLIILIHYITAISSQTKCNIVITSASTPGAMSISVGGTVVNSALFISFTETTYTFKLIAIDSSCTVISVNPLTIEDMYKLPRGTIIVGALDGPMPADTGDRDVVYQAAEQRLQPFGISASSVCDKTSDIVGSTQDADDILTFMWTIGQPEDAFLIASGTDPTDKASYTKYTDNSCISSLPSTDILGSPYDGNSVSQDSTIVISDTFTCTGTIYGWQYVPQEESDAFFAVYSESSGKYNLKDSNHVRTSSTDAINGVQYTCVSDNERISVTSGDMYGIYYDTSTLSNGPGIHTLANGPHISTMPFPCGRQPTDADLDVIVSGTFKNNTGHAPGSSETYGTAVGGALGLRPIMDPDFHLNCGCSFDSDCQAGGDSNMVCVSGTCKCYDSRIFDPTHNLCVLDMAKEQPVTTSSNATNSDPSHVNDGDVTTCHSTDPALSTASSPHVTLDLGVTTGVYAVSITTPETNTAIETGTTSISSGTGTVSISPVDDRVCVTIDGDATIQDVDEKTSGEISLTADSNLNVEYKVYDAILHDLVVYVSNSQTPYATFDAIPASDVCRFYTGVIPHNTTIYASCDNVVSGRYLHIQYTCAAEPYDQPLQICDVKVYGPEDSTLKPCTTDAECQQAGDQDLICMNLVCACRDGYRYRNRRCEDNLNECTQSNPCEQLCTNLENGDGYTCGCYSEYTIDANNKNCSEIDYKISTWPTFGPADGGTLITVSGTNLPTAYNVSISIGGKLCETQLQNSTIVIGVTPSLHNNSDLIGAATPVSLIADSTLLIDTSHVFIYKENPVITNVYPKESIVIGGTLLTVNGDNLDSVAVILMEVTMVLKTLVTENPMVFDETRTAYNTQCQTENTTQMYCPTPILDIPEGFLDQQSNPVKRETDHRLAKIVPLTGARRPKRDAVKVELSNDGDVLEFYAGFRLDGVANYTNYTTIDIYTEPTFGFEIKTYIFRKKERLNFNGKDLDVGITIADYQIIIGSAYCADIELVSNSLSCIPPQIRPDIQGINTQDPPIVIHIGLNLQHAAGYLHYPDTSDELPLYIIIPATVLPVVVISIVLTAIYECRKNRVCCNRRPR